MRRTAKQIKEEYRTCAKSVTPEDIRNLCFDTRYHVRLISKLSIALRHYIEKAEASDVAGAALVIAGWKLSGRQRVSNENFR